MAEYEMSDQERASMHSLAGYFRENPKKPYSTGETIAESVSNKRAERMVAAAQQAGLAFNVYEPGSIIATDKGQLTIEKGRKYVIIEINGIQASADLFWGIMNKD